MTQLSVHFSLEEATDSSTAVRAGIDNTPNEEQLANMKVQAVGMEQIRAVLNAPIHIDSWLRVEALEKLLTVKDFEHWCAEHDLEVGHDAWLEYFPRKAHPKGFGTDYICPDFGTPADIVKKIRDSGIKVDQCICEGTWVHTSFAPEMRNQFMIATFKDGVPSYEYIT